MTSDAEALAALHAEAMAIPAPWSAQDFRALLASPGTFVITSHGAEASFGERQQDLAGFALGRVVLDEAELLTIAVSSAVQRHGLGRFCLAGFEAKAASLGATAAHLEVAASNDPARALYDGSGWHQTGLRKAYYRGPGGRIDAILMQKALNPASCSDFSADTQDSY